jgi:hypothetical protein
MNRKKTIAARDAYLNKLKAELQDKFPDALKFYENEENTKVVDTSAWPTNQNSKKGLETQKGIATDAELRHLLRRVFPGFSKETFLYFQGKTKAEIVEELLVEELMPEAINDYSDLDPDVPFGESFANAGWSNDFTGERVQSLKSMFINEMRTNSTSMHSTMWFFWHNHLVTEMWGIFNGKMSYKYLKLLHDFSFGNFKELMYQITIDPSMLIYLNGVVNNKDAPDENYGRELQELFTIGKGPDANYTESDVQQAARVLTGWNLNWAEAETVFYEWSHDTSDKQFSEFYGNTVITGKSGQDGMLETQELIDMIFETNEVAAFIVRQLYTFFVYATIDDDTEQNIIQPLAQVLRDNDYVIKPVLSQLLQSDHFFDEVNYGAIIKSPLDIMLGWWKGMNVEMPFDPDQEIHEKFLVNRSMLWTMDSWGMQIGDPPNVAGWPAYYQTPTYDKSWVTTNTIVRRISYVDTFLYWGFWFRQDGKVEVDFLEFAKTLDNPGDPNALIAEIQDLFFGMQIDEDVRIAIKGILLSGQSEDFYWTNAWNTWIADESDEAAKAIVFNRLRYALQRLFNLSEFQLK